MKYLPFIFAAYAVLTIGSQQIAAETINAEQRQAIAQLAADGKKAYLAKDYETFVGFLYPELVKALGGKEKVIQAMKSEEEKNVAAGLVIESFDFGTPDAVYTGSQFTVTFLTTTMIASANGSRVQSKSFFVAFSPLKNAHWYFLDGTRLTKQQFQQFFHGLPDDLELPQVERKRL